MPNNTNKPTKQVMGNITTPEPGSMGPPPPPLTHKSQHPSGRNQSRPASSASVESMGSVESEHTLETTAEDNIKEMEIIAHNLKKHNQGNTTNL